MYEVIVKGETKMTIRMNVYSVDLSKAAAIGRANFVKVSVNKDAEIGTLFCPIVATGTEEDLQGFVTDIWNQLGTTELAA